MPNGSAQPIVGKAILKERGLYVDESWYWISVGALFAFSVLFNVLFILAITYLNRKSILLLNFSNYVVLNGGRIIF